MNHALILTGAPGSGKDFILRNALGEHKLIELSLDKLYNAIIHQEDLYEVDSHQSLVINGNADRVGAVDTCMRVLEAMDYKIGMVYVYTTDETSKARNDARIARGAKTFTESARAVKYQQSIEAMNQYSEVFGESFWLFNNSGDVNEQTNLWLEELKGEISAFLGEEQKYDSMQHYNQAKHPTQLPAPAEPHKSNIKGFERVKDYSGKWVLKRKQTTESHKYNSLNQAFETYSATAVDNSRGNTNVAPNGSPTENPATVMAKVLKPKKKTPGDTQSGIAYSSAKTADAPMWESLSVDIFHGGDPESKKRSEKKEADAAQKKVKSKDKESTKGANPPPNFFDGRVGMVPSGSVGITSSYVPSGKPLSELRKTLKRKK